MKGFFWHLHVVSTANLWTWRRVPENNEQRGLTSDYKRFPLPSSVKSLITNRCVLKVIDVHLFILLAPPCFYFFGHGDECQRIMNSEDNRIMIHPRDRKTIMIHIASRLTNESLFEASHSHRPRTHPFLEVIQSWWWVLGSCGRQEIAKEKKCPQVSEASDISWFLLISPRGVINLFVKVSRQVSFTSNVLAGCYLHDTRD